jgi:hypothetical protein
MWVGRRFALVIALPLALAAASACVSTSPSREFARDLNPAIGKAGESFFIDKYGDPDKRTSVDGVTDVWEYRFAGERADDHASRGNLTTVTLLRLTFRNGVLYSWQATNAIN